MIERLDSNFIPEDKRLLMACKAAVQSIVPDADLILYGSRARGDAQEDSDYDLLVLVDRQTDVELEKAIVDRLFPLELQTGRVLTMLVYNRAQWNSPIYQAMPFHRNVTQEGVVL